ncbi:hypothetical protein FA95DRAFT_1606302 [Auriscalpium vulgare]|uniref:Uncharacterized protein n=1 Tax=Auriscalpium vulgare TaxID=40419 RepID=A0ACB8RUL4_9AGAM|nr:hypothetical protein FA95DRAFT_1606302 [Auriscalpium vulgare]
MGTRRIVDGELKVVNGRLTVSRTSSLRLPPGFRMLPAERWLLSTLTALGQPMYLLRLVAIVLKKNGSEKTKWRQEALENRLKIEMLIDARLSKPVPALAASLRHLILPAPSHRSLWSRASLTLTPRMSVTLI